MPNSPLPRYTVFIVLSRCSILDARKRVSRTEYQISRFTLLLVLFRQFFYLFSVSDFSCPAHAINDGHSLDVVVFVLKRSGIQAFSFFGKLITVKVGSSYFAFFVSSYFCENTRCRQTSFFKFDKFADRGYG